MTDKEFYENIQLIKSKDKAGLKQIYVEYVSLIYHTILNVIKNPEDASDITSEFFIKLNNVADRYQPGNGHKTWLVTIARNMTIDYIRAHKREISTEDSILYTESSGDNIEANVVAEQSFKDLIKTLKPKEQELLTLKIVGEFTFKEISELLKEPMGTITWRYREAINKLRRNYHE